MTAIDAQKLVAELRAMSKRANENLDTTLDSATATNAALGAAMMVLGGLANAIEAAITEPTDASN